MQIEELNSFVMLFDTYGKLLSNKQFEVMEKFLNLDLSETELAEFSGESRQSVHDAIAKAKKQLLTFEEKCGVLKSKTETKQQLQEVLAFLAKENLGNNQIVAKISDIIENL